MKVLVTGANGFIGKNLVSELRNRQYENVFEFERDTDIGLLDDFCREVDFVFHLAGVNRPQEQSEYMEGNIGFTSTLLSLLKKHENTCPIVFSSSIQATENNPYGLSKKGAEDLLFQYGRETGAKILIYRLPNVFGKWCKPNYNSVVATFCHNIARGLPIRVDDPNITLNLVYVDDVVEEMMNALIGKETKAGEFCEIPIVYSATLGKIADFICSFRRSRYELSVPNMNDPFVRKLYSTYLSYLPEDEFSYQLQMNVDSRGSFTEFLRTPDRGQVSINITKPHSSKGHHWHHTKNEKFLVVSGRGVIRFRRVDSSRTIEYYVSGDKMEVVEVPPGYVHSIENLGETDMVTIMWANEPFDAKRPDTYYSEV